MKKVILLLLFLLSLSVCLNLFQWSNATVTCDNIDAQTNELISRLSPTPTPSWIVASPYTSIYPPTTTTASNG